MSDMIDFTTLKKWIPDYANAVAISNPRSYTATADGFVSVCYSRYSSNSSTYITVKMNNVVVAKQSGWATDAGGYKLCFYTGMFQVKTGDKITSDASGDTENYGYFIPGKWA